MPPTKKQKCRPPQLAWICTVVPCKIFLLKLALAGSLGLLLTLNGRLLISLALADLSQHAAASSAALKTAQSALEGLALFDTDLRHLFPSLDLRQEFAGQNINQ